MKCKQCHKIFVIPKLFRSIGFNEENVYSIGIQVIQKQGQIRSYLPSNPQIRNIAEKVTNKYETQRFFIQYNEHIQYLKGKFMFTIESQLYNPKVQILISLLKYDVRMALNRLNQVQKSVKALQESDEKQRRIRGSSQLVDSCKFIIKVGEIENQDQNYLQKVSFRNKNYFSSFVFYLGHVKIGQYFLSSHLIGLSSSRYEQFKEESKLKALGLSCIVQFYNQFIVKTIGRLKEIERVRKNALQQENINEYNLCTIQAINKNSLLTYYQVETLRQLENIIYQQSYKLQLHLVQKFTSLYNAIYGISVHNIEEKANKKLLSRIKTFPTKQIKYYDDILDHIPTVHMSSPIYDLEKQCSINSHHILFVFAHGLSGSQFDMNKIKTHINSFMHAQFLLLTNIKSHDGESVQILGLQAGRQIQHFITNRNFITKINFIGFSLGGLILRASLKYLKKYKEKFNMCITFSTPHLGLIQVEDCLVKAGLFYLKSVKNMRNIKQLCNEDRNESKSTILQDLATDQSLKWIKDWIFIGSEEDYYIPYESSMMKYEGENQILQKLQENIKKNVNNMIKMKVQISHENSCFWNKYIGKNHIYFIENDSFIYYVISSFAHKF